MVQPDGSQDGLNELIRRLEYVDRPTREQGLAQKYSNQGKITTLMLRNIPSKYTQDQLLEELVECMGSSDGFDFFYLPWDQQNDCNIGFAFVNFRTVQAAERCIRIFTNFSFRRFDSPKVCKVYPAHIQGLENNVLHLMDRAVSEARSHYPVIMWKGEKLKLGKVIAALDVQRRKLPCASAPGKFVGNREPPMTWDAHLSGGGMHMEGMDKPWAGGTDPEEEYLGEGFGVEEQRGEARQPGALEGAWSSGRLPPGLLEAFPDRSSPEADVVEAMPGLRAAMLRRRQAGNCLGSAGGAPGCVQTIELRNPDDDVLSKFLRRFGS